MPESTYKEISQGEWKVMKALWSLSSAAARDICQITQDQYGMSDSTTRTLLRRLVDKGHIKTTQIGNSFLYEPTSPMLDTICQAADQLLDKTPQETTTSVMMHLVKRSHLSGQDIRELREVLDQCEKQTKKPKSKKVK